MKTTRLTLRFGVWMLSCLATTVVTAPAAGSSLSCYIPVLASDAGEFLGLSFVNTAAVVNDVTVTWTNDDGTGSRSGRVSLAPGAQRSSLVRDLLGTPDDPRDGWIRIEFTNAGLQSYLTSGTDRILDGAEPVLQPATTILLGHIAVQTGFYELYHMDTYVILINPGNVTAIARAELIGTDGRTAGSQTIQIAASGSRVLRVSETFRDVLPANSLGGRTFTGYMKVVSNPGLAGWVRIDTPLSRRLLRGRGIEEIEPASLAMAAHFAYGSANLYRSALNLVNIGDASVALEITAQDDRGGRIGSAAQIKLGSGQGMREDAASLFRIIVPDVFPPPLVTGYVRIRAVDGSQFRVIGDVDVYSDGNRAAMLYPLETAAALDWIMPFVVSGQDYFTGYAVANPNELLTVQADMTVELLDTEGRPAAPPRTISLSPSARFAGLVEKGIESGYLRVHSNGPVILLGSLGTCNGETLAHLPAFRLPSLLLWR